MGPVVATPPLDRGSLQTGLPGRQVTGSRTTHQTENLGQVPACSGL